MMYQHMALRKSKMFPNVSNNPVIKVISEPWRLPSRMEVDVNATDLIVLMFVA
jgi:hypothetical protein